MSSFLRQIVRCVAKAVTPAPARMISSMSCSIKTVQSSASLFAKCNIPLTFSAPVRAFHIKRKTNKRKLTKKYKLKSHRATVKRFDITGTGRIMRWKAGKRHLARRKSKRQLRKMSHKVDIPKQLYKRYKQSLLF